MRPIAALLVALLVAIPVAAQKRRAVGASPHGWVTVGVGGDWVSGLAADSDGRVRFGGKANGWVSPSRVVTLLEAPELHSYSGPTILTSDRRFCAVLDQQAGPAIGCVSETGDYTEIAIAGVTTISAIAETMDGTLWVSAGSQIVSVSRAGEVRNVELPPSLSPSGGIAVRPDGTLFFSTNRALGRVVGDSVIEEKRFDDLFAPRPPYSAFAPELATTRDGALWMTVPSDPRTNAYQNHAAIIRVALDGTVTAFDAGYARFPSRLTPSNADDSLWYIDADEWFSGHYFYYVAHLWPDGTVAKLDTPISPWAPAYYYGLAIDALGQPWINVNDLSNRKSVLAVFVK